MRFREKERKKVSDLTFLLVAWFSPPDKVERICFTCLNNILQERKMAHYETLKSTSWIFISSQFQRVKCWYVPLIARREWSPHIGRDRNWCCTKIGRRFQWIHHSSWGFSFFLISGFNLELKSVAFVNFLCWGDIVFFRVFLFAFLPGIQENIHLFSCCYETSLMRWREKKEKGFSRKVKKKEGK